MTNQEFEIFVERSRIKLLAIAHQYLGAVADAEDVVQEALLNRNCTQAVYEADREAINSMKLKLRITDAQLARDWQASGERGY